MMENLRKKWLNKNRILAKFWKKNEDEQPQKISRKDD